VHKEQGDVLIEEELPIAGAVALGADVVEALQQRRQQAEVLEALELFRGDFAASLSHRFSRRGRCHSGRSWPSGRLCSCFRAKGRENGARR
jgi:hypothetical protein